MLPKAGMLRTVRSRQWPREDRGSHRRLRWRAAATRAPHNRSSPDGVRPGPSPSRSIGGGPLTDRDRRALTHFRNRLIRGRAMRSRAVAGSPMGPNTMRASPSTGAFLIGAALKVARGPLQCVRPRQCGANREDATLRRSPCPILRCRSRSLPHRCARCCHATAILFATRAQSAMSTVALSGPLPMLASPTQRKSLSASRYRLRAKTATSTADAWRRTKRSACEPQYSICALVDRL